MIVARTVLVESINDYLTERNLSPKRYVWKAKGAEILAKIQRARETLEKQQCIGNSETLH